jgi:hypothetical protein
MHAVKQSGLEYPLFYALWDSTSTKFELALEMLKNLRAALPEKLRLRLKPWTAGTSTKISSGPWRVYPTTG